MVLLHKHEPANPRPVSKGSAGPIPSFTGPRVAPGPQFGNPGVLGMDEAGRTSCTITFIPVPAEQLDSELHLICGQERLFAQLVKEMAPRWRSRKVKDQPESKASVRF